MMNRVGLVLCLLLLSFPSFAQIFAISGRIVDQKDTAALISVTVRLTKTDDTSVKNGNVTDADGNFTIGSVAPGPYSLQIDYLGYNSVTRTVTVTDQDVNLGTITMTTGTRQLKTVTIAGKQVRAEQVGDTSSFNAGAYKTNPDASAEDLVSKMPGVTSDNTGVKVNGEAVQQVYVDGKPFFGTDPSLALKNLPAEVIDKIQVFDKLSDQSMFTGFDDGSSQKTINIITKRNKNEGVFGKVYAGYGTDERYIAGGNLNFFNGNRRISLIGLSNNINQQNFSSEDVLGITGSSGQGRGGGGPRGGGGRGSSGGQGGPGGGGGNNFMVGQQGGITTTHSLGFNYSDNWGKKVKVTGSYFFNATNNVVSSSVVRDYFSDISNIYREQNFSESKNQNHRVNMRLEYTMDSFNSITFTPNISFQKNNTISTTYATDSIGGLPASISDIRNTANNTGYSASGNFLYQHRFAKPRRTISFNVNSSLNEKTGDGSYFSHNIFYEPLNDTTRDQQYDLYNNTNTISGNVTYTEPVGKKGQLQLSYNPSVSLRHSDKQTFNRDSIVNDYSSLDTLLSNKYDNTYTTQRGGLSYRIGDRKLNFNVGANFQYAMLDGEQQFPRPFTLERTFTNVLPNAMLNYKYDDGRNIRIMYRTNTTEPSITQLQNVVDISNPLLLRTGNATLNQAYEHTFITRYGLTKGKTGRNFFLNVYANYVDDYIGNQNIIPSRDSVFVEPISGVAIDIPKGSQLTRPVNLSGYWSARSFLTYGFPIETIKSNLNLNGGFNFNQNPGMINDVVNYSRYYTPSFGLVLGSNISENLDFTLSYNGNYNIVRNTVQTQANTSYYSHIASLRFNWIFLKNFVLNTSAIHNYYTAFSNTEDQSFVLWNAYLGYKMLKSRALEARLSVYDILNQNRSITRNVTDLYVENNVTQVLKQYFMFQLTYTVRSFKGSAGAAANTLAPADEETRPQRPAGERGTRGERGSRGERTEKGQ
ncbi:MAG: TonB-dependent receptor [Bacteroidota bacterium]